MGQASAAQGAAHGAAQGAPQGGADRLLTLPNLLSLLRLLLVPVFLYLVLGPHADGWAFLILVFSGISDYLDGKLARSLNQVSQLGAVLDPLADRLYIVSTIIAFGVRGIVPWWFVGLLVLRDLALLGFVPVLGRLGYKTLPVHFLGKAGTFTLLYAFPLLLLSTWDNWVGTVARPAGWAFAIWGLALYWWAGALYVYQVRLLWREQKAETAAGVAQPARRTGPANRASLAGPAGPAEPAERTPRQGGQREARA